MRLLFWYSILPRWHLLHSEWEYRTGEGSHAVVTELASATHPRDAYTLLVSPWFPKGKLFFTYHNLLLLHFREDDLDFEFDTFFNEDTDSALGGGLRNLVVECSEYDNSIVGMRAKYCRQLDLVFLWTIEIRCLGLKECLWLFNWLLLMSLREPLGGGGAFFWAFVVFIQMFHSPLASQCMGGTFFWASLYSVQSLVSYMYFLTLDILE